MCMLFVELCDSPAPDGFRLILASNRDESYRRPTDRAHQWEEAPSVIGGRDREPGRSGGTWLAMDTAGAGRVAALLNVMSSPSLPESLPRGMLVADYVRSPRAAAEYVAAIADRGLEYSAFHLVTIDLNPSASLTSAGPGGMWHYSNCSSEDGVASEVSYMRRGRLALGNSVVGQPFRKVSAGGERFGGIVERLGRRPQRDALVEELVSLLKWDHKHLPDEALEARVAKGNIAKERLPDFSAIFQRHLNYGTRTHTVILVDADWRCDFYEWTLGESMETPIHPDSSDWKHIHKTFQLQPPTMSTE